MRTKITIVVAVLAVHFSMAVADVPTQFLSPVNLTGINTSYVERDASLTADGLEIYFASDRPGGSGGLDVWFASRTSRTESFMNPVNLGQVNTLGSDENPGISADGLNLYFARSWSGHTKMADIYVSHRTTRLSPWSSPVAVSELNTANGEGYPCLLSNGLTIYWASTCILNGITSEELFVATRETLDSPFGTPTRISELSTNYSERDPWVSNDGLSIYFSSSRPNPSDLFRAYAAERLSINDPFSAPVLVEGLNSIDRAGAPFFDQAESSLYFHVPDQPGGMGNNDIWVATATPEPATLSLLTLGGLAMLKRRGLNK